MQKPSIILTGASGLVGSRFVELYSSEFEIHNLDLATGVDITNPSQVDSFIAAHPATALIHLAAFTDTTRAESEVGQTEGICYRVNVLGTKNIVNSATTHQLHLIHVSTDFVFDGENPPEGGYLESSPLCPIGWYGKTKAMAEELVQQSTGSTAIARLSYPYRANFTLKADLVKKIRQGLASASLPPQFTDTIITPTFVDDIAHGFAALVRQQSQGIYHLVGTSHLSPYQLAQQVAKVFGFDPALVKPGTLAAYLADHPRPFAKNGTISNIATSAALNLTFADIETGLRQLKDQES